MGRDIHLFLETSVDGQRWYGPIGQWRPGRDYIMFSLMADVLGDGGMFPPRGLPKDICWEARSAAYLQITDNEELADEGIGYCTRESAERWVKDGSSEWLDERQKMVSDPDAHSHSWLSTEEFAQCLQEAARRYEAYNKEHGGKGYVAEYEPGYDALFAAMQAYEKRGRKARIVFWFDN